MSVFICENCGKEFEKGYGKKNRFCTRSCCASFNAKKGDIKKKRESITRARSFIKNPIYKCKVCHQTFSNSGILRNHVRWVHKEGKNEIIIRSLAMTSSDKNKKERICQYCGKISVCYAWHMSNHEKRCEKNPNRVSTKGHTHSEESKRKISESARKNSYRRIMKHTQLYNSILYDSSWEVEMAKRLEFLNEEFERPKTPISYIAIDGLSHHYFPDFYLPKRQKFLEIKNPYLFENDDKVKILKNTRKDIIWLTSLDQIKNFKL